MENSMDHKKFNGSFHERSLWLLSDCVLKKINRSTFVRFKNFSCFLLSHTFIFEKHLNKLHSNCNNSKKSLCIFMPFSEQDITPRLIKLLEDIDVLINGHVVDVGEQTLNTTQRFVGWHVCQDFYRADASHFSL